VTEDDKQAAAERLLKAREAAAAEFKLDIDDWRTRRLAMLQAVYAQAEDMLANGRSVDSLPSRGRTTAPQLLLGHRVEPSNWSNQRTSNYFVRSGASFNY
jgi:hypothetical protein